jgi:hypothetical protein
MRIRALFSVASLGLLLAAGCSSPTAPRLPPEDDRDRPERPPVGAFNTVPAVMDLLA